MTIHQCCPALLIFLFFLGEVAAQQGIAFPFNPHAYWYFLTPSSYGPPPGKAIFQNVMLAAMQYQKTTQRGNTYTIGLIPSLLLGKSAMPVWVSAHRRIPLGGQPEHPFATANIGGFFLSIPKQADEREGRDLSLFYTNVNFGNREKNFAIGAAVVPTGLRQGGLTHAFTLHGITRLGPRSCLITENYLIHDQGAWLPCSMSGWRGWRKRTALDVSLLLARIPASWRSSNQSSWLPIPWISIHRTLAYDFFNRTGD